MGRSRSESGEGIRLTASLVPSLLPLMLRLGGTYLRFKKQAQKGGRIFEKELRASGMDKDTARAFTEIYLDTSRILRMFDFSDMVKNV